MFAFDIGQGRQLAAHGYRPGKKRQAGRLLVLADVGVLDASRPYHRDGPTPDEAGRSDGQSEDRHERLTDPRRPAAQRLQHPSDGGTVDQLLVHDLTDPLPLHGDAHRAPMAFVGQRCSQFPRICAPQQPDKVASVVGGLHGSVSGDGVKSLYDKNNSPSVARLASDEHQEAGGALGRVLHLGATLGRKLWSSDRRARLAVGVPATNG